MKLNKPLIIFDLETTGTDITIDRIVQIATMKLFPNGECEEKEYLINPGIPIPKEASEVHGITDEMVKDAPTFKQLANAMNDYFKGSDIGGYNSDNFDVPLLMQEFHRCEIEFPSWELNFVDMLKIERIVNSHKLSETYKRYTLQDLDDAHDAMADVKGTKTVFDHQLELLKETEGFEEGVTIESIDKFCQGDNERFDYAGKAYIKDGVVYWSFGKWKDHPVLDDRGYLNWVLSSNFPIETKKKLKELLIK